MKEVLLRACLQEAYRDAYSFAARLSL